MYTCRDAYPRHHDGGAVGGERIKRRDMRELFAIGKPVAVRIREERTRPVHQFLAYIHQTVTIKVCAGTELQKKTIHRLKRERRKRNTIDKIGFGIRDIVVADKLPEVRAKILCGKEV